MRAKIAILVIFTAATCCVAQVKPRPTAFKFPEANSEFVVTFPSRPIVQTLYGSQRTGRQAELLLDGLSFIRAENSTLSATDIAKFTQMDDATFANIPLSYAKNIGLSNPIVSVSNSSLGRYAKLRGYTEINGTSISYEVYIYIGKTDSIGLYVASPSKSFPSPAIVRFLNSVRKRSSKE